MYFCVYFLLKFNIFTLTRIFLSFSYVWFYVRFVGPDSLGNICVVLLSCPSNPAEEGEKDYRRQRDQEYYKKTHRIK